MIVQFRAVVRMGELVLMASARPGNGTKKGTVGERCVVSSTARCSERTAGRTLPLCSQQHAGRQHDRRLWAEECTASSSRLGQLRAMARSAWSGIFPELYELFQRDCFERRDGKVTGRNLFRRETVDTITARGRT